MNGLARSSVRFRPASFIGTFVALFATSVIVMACGSLLQTGITARVEPVRYAAAPIVVSSDQFARMIVGNGEDREEVTAALPEGSRIDTSIVSTITSVPGIVAAVPDLAVALVGDDVGTVRGHDWSTRALDEADPLVGHAPLDAGTPPGRDDVVLDAATARAAGLSIGDQVRLTAPDGLHEFRLSGIVADRAAGAADGPAGARPSAWFDDGVAAALAGHPGSADAIAVFTDPGVDTKQVARELQTKLGDTVQVHTGSDRGGLEAPGLPAAKELLLGLGGSFGGTATFAALFVVIATVALVVGQRHREIALLRAIGATPRQIRRMVATEALLVAPIAGVLGILPGLFLGRWWFDQLVSRGGVPLGVELSTGVFPAIAAVFAGLLAALLGGWFAARRPAKTPPSQALGEAAVERHRLGRTRWVAGFLTIGVGVALSVISFQLDGSSAAVTSIGVVMMFLTAVAILGPAIARTATAVLGLPMRRGTAASSLAAVNSEANSRRLASAITPIALVIGATGVLLFIQPTVAYATRADIRDGLVADHVISSDGPGLPMTAIDDTAAIPGVRTAVGLMRSEVLYRGFEEFESAAAIAVTGDLADLGVVLDLGVDEGDLADLAVGTVALDHLLADALGARVGETVDLRLGDGTEHSPEVIAVYEHGLGLGQVLLPLETLTDHVRTPYVSEVLIASDVDANDSAIAEDLRELDIAGTVVTDRAAYAAQIDENLELEAWANRVMAAVFGGFAAITATNTLVMVVVDRRREVTLLRLTGTTRQQIRAMFSWEAAIVAITGIGLGSAIAVFTLVGFASGATGGLPYIPPLQGLGVIAIPAIIAFGAMAIPARALMRRPPRAGAE